MHPYFHIFGLALPAYGLMAVLGFGSGFALAVWRSRRMLNKTEDCFFLLLFALIGGGAGAKLLYFLTVLPDFLRIGGGSFESFEAVLRYLFGGFVYYGGLFGAIGGAAVYCRLFAEPFSPLALAAVPSLPLIHAFGRVGCFLAGCCYGRPVGADRWYGVVLGGAPQLGPLVPVQLVEAGFNLLLFAFLLWYSRPPRTGRQALGMYLASYAVARFLLEFLRGDAARGSIGPLSTSQWISIFALAAGLWLLLRRKGFLPARNGQTAEKQ